ncbi:MAG: ATP-dependent zinc metalloprotease FtsH [SAR324 cluster bacterium]|nr:ATP-dependent zinc metalloprotease FtsH [SAR324 cluster bacterium]
MIGPMNKKQLQFSIWYFLAAMGILFYLNALVDIPETTIEFSEFKKKIEAGEIQRVKLGERYYTGFLQTRQTLEQLTREKKKVERTYRTTPVEDPSLIALMDKKGVEYYKVPITFLEMLVTATVSWVLPFILILIIWRFMFSRMGGMGGVMSFGRNQAKVVAEGDTGVLFDDVAGAEESKEELKEVVDFLKTPEKYEAIGGKVPKGVLLVGPPGTGKTMLAKAVAGEAKVPFFRISGADFVEMFVGVGASRVRDLFKQARENAPCIIFIDELDAIGKSRSTVGMANDEREQTLNQLLVEMDGFEARGGVIILAATNRPNILDPALLRPGRFDRQVLVDRPDLLGREAILNVHSKNVKLEKNIDLKKVAQSTAGFAGADLANLVNEAAIMAVRVGREEVIQKDFEDAFEKIVAGLAKKNRVLNPKERKIVAYHETGHALVAALTTGAEPVQKISIVPRGLGSLGYTMQLPTEDRYLVTEEEMLGKIDVLLGGRAAEKIIFNQITSGASNDLARSTEIAKKMITEYGMSEEFENVVLSSHQPTFLGDGSLQSREFSEETQRYIDQTIAKMIKQRFQHVMQLLQNKEETLHAVATQLLTTETMDATEFAQIIHHSSKPK